MRKIILCLLVSLTFPISVNANIEDQYFPNLKVRPRNFSEWYHLGVITSYGGILCIQYIAEDLTLAQAMGYRDGMVNVYSNEGERAKEFTIDAINEGILVMQNMDNSPFSKEQRNKCNSLKIK
mgnify:FL=1